MYRTLVSCTVLTLTVAAVLVTAPRARAALTPEQRCLKGRYDAAAKYAQCEQKATGKFLASDVDLGDLAKYQKAVSKCRVKYAGTWPKLQKKASGTGATCDGPRFVDAVTAVDDRLTGLGWEKKVSPGGGATDPHDVDNIYTWSAGGGGFRAADGTAFTDFLAKLNGGCFLTNCDWRLPTRAELQTILSEPHPCTTSPCIDPIFGPTVASGYWSATTLASGPGNAWVVGFGVGFVITGDKDFGGYVRGVRAGL